MFSPVSFKSDSFHPTSFKFNGLPTITPPANNSGGNLATQDWTDVLNRRQTRRRVRVQCYAWHEHRAACIVHIRTHIPAISEHHAAAAFCYRPIIRTRYRAELSIAHDTVTVAVPRIRFHAQKISAPANQLPRKIRLGGPLPISDNEAIAAIIAYKARQNPTR